MIYQRDQNNPNKIDSLNMVLKGSWKLTVEDNFQDFIYKKVSEPQNEDLLTTYFCEDPKERIHIANSNMNELNVYNYQSIKEKLFDS